MGMRAMTTLQSPKPRLNSAFKQLMSVHWWMAAIYLLLMVVGTAMSQLERNAPLRNELYDFHKSFGVVSVLLLGWRLVLLFRVWWKKYTQRSPKITADWIRTTILHSSLYLFMVSVPIAGFLLSNSFRANNVKFFGLVLPDIFPQNEAMVDVGRGLHFWLSYLFLALIGLHAIAQWKVIRANWRRFKNFIQTGRKPA
jgi:cytochrome b561